MKKAGETKQQLGFEKKKQLDWKNVGVFGFFFTELYRKAQLQQRHLPVCGEMKRRSDVESPR